jgi:threonine dehydratase
VIELENFIKAKHRLSGIIKKTGIDLAQNFSRMYGGKVYLKPENLQKTGSFKIRGAYNCISNLTIEERNNGIIAFSAGNHAQGVAYAAKKMGCKAVVIMPESAPAAKVKATEEYGAKVIKCGGPTENRIKKVQELIKIYGYKLIHPFDDKDIICGQGTIGLELLDDIPDLEAVVVPVSGGGLISGIATVLKKIKPNVKIYGVQPENSSAMYQSYHEGKICSCDKPDTVADALIAQRPGKLTLEMTLKYVDDIVLVTETEIINSCLLLAERAKFVVEPGGVVGLSAVINKKIPVHKNVAVILSGGNMDLEQLGKFILRGGNTN